MYQGIKLISTELVLIPFWLVLCLPFNFLLLHFCLSLKIPDVTERHPRYSDGRTRASNLVFTIWTVFGGFILHFLLSNYLTVLLKPSYEEPVETAADLINRGLTPIMWPTAQIYRQFFAASSDPIYQEISRRLVIAKDWDEYDELSKKVISTGLYAEIKYLPYAYPEEYKDWYRSSKPISGDNPYVVHLTNKKWPLKKVLSICKNNKYNMTTSQNNLISEICS